MCASSLRLARFTCPPCFCRPYAELPPPPLPRPSFPCLCRLAVVFCLSASLVSLLLGVRMLLFALATGCRRDARSAQPSNCLPKVRTALPLPPPAVAVEAHAVVGYGAGRPAAAAAACAGTRLLVSLSLAHPPPLLSPAQDCWTHRCSSRRRCGNALPRGAASGPMARWRSGRAAARAAPPAHLRRCLLLWLGGKPQRMP